MIGIFVHETTLVNTCFRRKLRGHHICKKDSYFFVASDLADKFEGFVNACCLSILQRFFSAITSDSKFPVVSTKIKDVTTQEKLIFFVKLFKAGPSSRAV